MYLCMCVCVYIYIYAHICSDLSTCIYACMQYIYALCMYLRVCIRMLNRSRAQKREWEQLYVFACVYTHTEQNTCTEREWEQLYVFACVYTHTEQNTCTKREWEQLYVFACVYICILNRSRAQ